MSFFLVIETGVHFFNDRMGKDMVGIGKIDTMFFDIDFVFLIIPFQRHELIYTTIYTNQIYYRFRVTGIRDWGYGKVYGCTYKSVGVTRSTAVE